MEDAIAQTAAMDCVVTISNTTAHTAGALGIPCALLLPKHTGRHWYWFRTETDQCAWYPSVTVFEVDPERDWAAHIPHVLDFVHQHLRSL